MPSILFNAGSSDRVMSVEEAAYVAGFMDGEGCLTIGRARRVESRSGFGYEALMTVSNTNLDVLKAIVVMAGNGKVQVSDKRKGLGHKTLYRIVFSANQIRHVLSQIRPYLIVKARQADILLAFLASKVSGRRTTPELWQSFEDARAEIRTMNLRGIKDTTAQTLAIRDVKPMPTRGPGRMCEYDGCAERHFAKGYCHTHYRRLVQRPDFRARGFVTT